MAYLLDYSNKSQLRAKGFFPKGKPPKDRTWYGIELEMESGSEENRQYDMDEIEDAIGSDFCVFKYDGSLNEDRGFELVTAPATPEFIRSRYDRMFASLPHGVTSWDSGDCGMHVHVSRTGLTALGIGKVVVFVNCAENRSFMKRVAGREVSCARMYASKKITDGAHSDFDRYEAVNLQNHDTIEFRIFRGTLNRNSFYKNLEFCVALVSYTRKWGARDLTYEPFCRFVRKTGKLYPHLKAFLQRYGYIPRPKAPNPDSGVTLPPLPVFHEI